MPKITEIYTFKDVVRKSDIAVTTIPPHSSRAPKSEELQQQLQAIKNRFSDAIWRSFIVIVLIGVPLSVARSFNGGWLPIYTLHLAYGLFVILIALNTKRLSLKLKSSLLIFTFWLIGLPAIITFGMP